MTSDRCENDDDEENASVAYVKQAPASLWSGLAGPFSSHPRGNLLCLPSFAPAVLPNTSFQIFDTSPSLAVNTVAKYRAVVTPIERCTRTHGGERLSIRPAMTHHRHRREGIESGVRISAPPALQGREGSLAAPPRYYYTTEPAGKGPWQWETVLKGRGIDLASTLGSDPIPWLWLSRFFSFVYIRYIYIYIIQLHIIKYNNRKHWLTNNLRYCTFKDCCYCDDHKFIRRCETFEIKRRRFGSATARGREFRQSR